MSAYQDKWVEVLEAAGLEGWKIEAVDDYDILVEMPNVSDLKIVRDNVPQVIAAFSLDIDVPKDRLRFIFKNGNEVFDYILNPSQEDLESGD